jgi:predicted phosphate transport protein (TIGR00153 family)
MRFGLFKLFRESPFEKLKEHAEKVQEGGDLFRTAIKCYLESDCVEFEELHMKVTTLESDADRIKQNIRAHLPKGVLLPVDKFQFLWYLREADKVLDAMQDALHWLSYRTTLVPEPLVDDLLLMVDKAVEVIDQLPPMVEGAVRYFRNFSRKERDKVKDVIRDLRQKEFESDQIERKLKSDVFTLTVDDPATTFHLIRTIEYIGEISNHAENAGDMMRAMIAR